jgi:hypothetical protein
MQLQCEKLLKNKSPLFHIIKINRHIQNVFTCWALNRMTCTVTCKEKKLAFCLYAAMCVLKVTEVRKLLNSVPWSKKKLQFMKSGTEIGVLVYTVLPAIWPVSQKDRSYHLSIITSFKKKCIFIF